MNTYPVEYKSPPLPLIAFVGCPELHKDIGTFFSQVLRPPLLSLGVADASEQLLTRVFGGCQPHGRRFMQAQYRLLGGAPPSAAPRAGLCSMWAWQPRYHRAQHAVAAACTPLQPRPASSPCA